MWLAPHILKTEVLAGLVVALALIPEAISFSIIGQLLDESHDFILTPAR